MHGLALRVALSCLVDADHADTTWFDTGTEPAAGAAARWPERLGALDAHVEALPDHGGERDRLRRAFYDACRHSDPEAALVACEGPVGIGKTTAVTAFLLRRAIETGARRLFIVAPHTAILSQTADRLRKALVLPGEDPHEIVAEHHHRADFSALSFRELATLWTAPIVVTTAVQFFETLAANEPRHLRKLHQLPGSVIFIDEAHAALPTRLWPQNWRWVRELAEDWSCSFVFASGSLTRFWTSEDVVGDKVAALPELTPPHLVEPLRRAEARRIVYETLGRFHDLGQLIRANRRQRGVPRLVHHVHRAERCSIVAMAMRAAGMMSSTCQTPCAQEIAMLLSNAFRGLESGKGGDWNLFATCLVDDGVELSFRRRSGSVSRTPRSSRLAACQRHESEEACGVYDFALSDDRYHEESVARNPPEVVERLFRQGGFRGLDADVSGHQGDGYGVATHRGMDGALARAETQPTIRR